jgi:hypothetical protein
MLHPDEDARLNRDKYDRQPDAHPGHPGLVGALVETVLNPFFILGRR